MNMNERLASLGVRLISSTNSDATKNEMGATTLVFVKVPPPPCAPEPAVQELGVDASSLSRGLEEDVFEPYFALQPSESVNMSLIQQQAEEARQCTTYMCPHVSPLTLQRAAEQGTLQHVVVAGIDQDVIVMYYDESAHFKQRPYNAKASQWIKNIEKAGNKEQEEEAIYGDVFLVRRVNGQFVSLDICNLEAESWFTVEAK